MIVLDTDIVTLLAYGNQKLCQRAAAEAKNEDLAITIITRMEVLQGRFASILKAADEAELQMAVRRFRAAEEMLADYALLYPDEASQKQFGKLLKQKKLKMKRPDMLIASIALAHKSLLVTKNIGDYQGIKDLRVDNWSA